MNKVLEYKVMSEILKEWLTERLKTPIKWEAEEFADLMKNGCIIADVLLSYNVINDEKYFLIRSSDVLEDIKNNWNYLAVWLRELQVDLNNFDLSNIIEGKGTTLLRIFYQIFLHLDKKDRTDFIKCERKMVSTLIDKMTSRFTIDKIGEEEKQFVDDLSKPLLNEKHFIDWQKKKAKEVKDTYDFMRYKYSKTLKKIKESTTFVHCAPQVSQKISSKEMADMNKYALKYPCKFENYTYEQLLTLEERAMERKKSLVNSEWVKNYMDNLHIKMHKKSDSEEFQKQISNVISTTLWNLSIDKEETKIDHELAKKVMKLSQFEKQMCTQIMETKQQARNLVQNRIRAEKEFADQREQQFNQYLDTIKQQIDLEVVEIDIEKHRQKMLDKKLYGDKIKRKRQYYYDTCYDTMLSIVDFATKYAYFKKGFGGDVPEHFTQEWKTLFYKQQPIFDILESMEDIIKKQRDKNPIVSEIREEDKIVNLELDRQEVMNEREFEEYNKYSHSWTLNQLIPNYDPGSDERKYEYLGSRILGHVVHTLLEIKYPYLPPRLPADLPNFTVKALLRGLPDKSLTAAMQILLNFHKIHVIRIESVINYCLKRFKNEISCTTAELSFDNFMAAAQKEEDKELIRMMKIDDEDVRKSSDANFYVVSGTFSHNTKQTQTPKTIPEEGNLLSTAADLGRYTYETLNFGDSLTAHLLAAMIVEYLKNQENINGFVIVNYPNSYREAQILEETFSGRAPPDDNELDDRDDIFLEESIVKHRKKEKESYKKLRVSRLVDNPHKTINVDLFDSYFTSYIKLKKTEDILQEPVIWNLTKYNSELIDRFYSILGINYSMYYEVIDKNLLAQICKYIIGDFAVPSKSCDKLFGENVLSLLDIPILEDQSAKSKIFKPDVSNEKFKGKIQRGSKSTKVSINNELEVLNTTPDSCDKMLKNTIISEGGSESDNDNKSLVSAKELKILAGEDDWSYGVIPISEAVGVTLATCWEEIEKTYINDIQQLFFAKRLEMNCLVPYTKFVKDNMEQIITLPCNKQDLVSRFQNDYNEFENDWRCVNLSKNEWHCRVKELQNKLYHVCDERKSYAEQQRLAFICDNWTIEELTTIVNTYISCMQAELNRFILTYQILHDFYFALIKRVLPNERLLSKDLMKIAKESENLPASRKGGDDKMYQQIKVSFQEKLLKNTKIDYTNNPFNLVIENNVKFALKVIKDTNDSYQSLISKEYNEMTKILPLTKRKNENISEQTINLEENFGHNALKCMEEWTMGINGEMFRACLRILALQYKCYEDMKLFNDLVYKTFMQVQDDINRYYLNEIKSVDRLCKYLQIAIEKGITISETLILENDTFVIDQNFLQFTNPEICNNKDEVIEFKQEIDFKVGQLVRLRKQLKIVAPTGVILQQAFIYVLQDYLLFGKETCEGPLFPDTWNRLNPEQIPKLVYILFGETSFVDWRDFLIYCLNIRFPTVDELLKLRKKFRCRDLNSTELISRDDFLQEMLWFEEDFDHVKYSKLRINLTKHFLFELFETSQDNMNYSAFLLAFCKSVNPLEGFATALSMAIGKKICFSLSDCQEVVNSMIKLKQYKDACLASAQKCAGQFLEKILMNVVDICEGTTITELEYTETLSDNDKKDKEMVTQATKVEKLKTSQSARSPKLTKNVLSNSTSAQSTTNVKNILIYSPREERISENPDVKKVDESNQSVIKGKQEDLNLTYAVSQVIIWKVLEICLPGYFVLPPEKETSPYIQLVKVVMKSLEGDTDNGYIYVCKFVTDANVCKLLHKVKKFTSFNLTEEVFKVLA